MKRHVVVAFVVLLAGVPQPGGPSAAEQGTQVDSLTAERSAVEVAVEGTATFVDVPVTVGTQEPGTTLVSGLGTDLVELAFARPDPFGDDLRVTISVFDQPEEGGVPEAICYSMWAEPSPWQADVYRTHQVYNPGSLEPVVALRPGFLEAEFVLPARMEDGVVEFEIPMSFIEVQPGTTIRPWAPGSSDPRPILVRNSNGGVLPCGGGTALDSMDWDEYVIPQATVSLGIAPAGTPPAGIPLTTQASVEPDGGFEGSLSVAGQPPGTYTVLARACYGQGNCAEATTTVTL